MELFKKYDSELQSTRNIYDSSDSFNKLISTSDKKILHAFWIAFSALGSFITFPVEGWIYRAGEACHLRGYEELGKQLMKHSKHEKDHHLLMLKDLSNLIQLWNTTYPEKLDIVQVSKEPESAVPYYNLHEDVINSDSPYRQIAIEYEIENLTLSHGQKVLHNTLALFGDKFKKNISFIFSHAKFDVAHTKFNMQQLDLFISKFPDTTINLIETGKKALKTYLIHMESCMKSALTFANGEEKNVICLAT